MINMHSFLIGYRHAFVMCNYNNVKIALFIRYSISIRSEKYYFFR